MTSMTGNMEDELRWFSGRFGKPLVPYGISFDYYFLRVCDRDGPCWTLPEGVVEMTYEELEAHIAALIAEQENQYAFAPEQGRELS